MSSARSALPVHGLIAAPMVGASDLAFRLLCRRHGAELAYTEMLFADRLASEQAYRQEVLLSQLHKHDHPLCVQLCGNDANVLVAAALLVEPHCEMVDLNLGCPQSRAQQRLEGAFLCEPHLWPRVFGLVRALVAALTVPVSCKIRLLEGDSASGLDGVEQTVRFARGLEAAGCSLLAVHGRRRGKPGKRRQGPADLDAIGRVKAALTIPVVSNGNVRRASDVRAALDATHADGVMVGEALLAYPALLASNAEDLPSMAKRRAIAQEYFTLAAEHPPPSIEFVRAHVSWMLGKEGRGAERTFKFARAFPPAAVSEMLRSATSTPELAALVAVLMDTHGGGICTAAAAPPAPVNAKRKR